MKLVTSKDEELLQTIHFIGKFPNRETIVLKALKKACQAGLKMKEVSLAYGYYHYITLERQGRGAGFMEANIKPIIDAYNQAISLDPEYWLAKMCKALLLLKIPVKEWGKVEMLHTIEQLIEQQTRQPEKHAYFIIPYIIYSDFCFTLGNSQQAWAVLKEGKRNSALEPMPFHFLKKIFTLLFKDYYNRLIFANKKELSATLGELGRIFLPEEKVFTEKINIGETDEKNSTGITADAQDYLLRSNDQM